MGIEYKPFMYGEWCTKCGSDKMEYDYNNEEYICNSCGAKFSQSYMDGEEWSEHCFDYMSDSEYEEMIKDTYRSIGGDLRCRRCGEYFEIRRGETRRGSDATLYCPYCDETLEGNDEIVYYYERPDSDFEFHRDYDDYDEDDEYDMPECCVACGNDYYPDCKLGCKLFDD